MDRPLIAVDTETANTRGLPHLLELGAVRVVDGEVVDRFEALVCPQVPIEPEASAVHGIEEDDIRDALTAGEVLRHFTEWAGADWFAAHDAPKDAAVLAVEAARHGAPTPPGPFLDSLKLARIHLSEATDHRLEALAELLELEGLERHRALPDAVTCWKVIEECVARQGGDIASSTLLAQCGAQLTVAGAAPPLPRLKPRHRRIVRAIETGESVRLVYGEDTDEPSLLSVRPLLLYQSQKKGYLEGECCRSGILKTYRLDRVHKVLPA